MDQRNALCTRTVNFIAVNSLSSISLSPIFCLSFRTFSITHNSTTRMAKRCRYHLKCRSNNSTTIRIMAHRDNAETFLVGMNCSEVLIGLSANIPRADSSVDRHAFPELILFSTSITSSPQAMRSVSAVLEKVLPKVHYLRSRFTDRLDREHFVHPTWVNKGLAELGFNLAKRPFDASRLRWNSSTRRVASVGRTCIQNISDAFACASLLSGSSPNILLGMYFSLFLSAIHVFILSHNCLNSPRNPHRAVFLCRLVSVILLSDTNLT